MFSSVLSSLTTSFQRYKVRILTQYKDVCFAFHLGCENTVLFRQVVRSDYRNQQLNEVFCLLPAIDFCRGGVRIRFWVRVNSFGTVYWVLFRAQNFSMFYDGRKSFRVPNCK